MGGTAAHGPTPEDDIAAFIGSVLDAPVPAHMRPALEATRRGERVAVATGPRMGRTAWLVRLTREALVQGESVRWVTPDGSTLLRTVEDLDRVMA